MKKTVKMVIDIDAARSGLMMNGDYEALNKDSDDTIIRKAVEKVEQFSSQFGVTVDKKRKVVLNENIERNVNVKVDTKIARSMLGCAGFYTDGKSDEEIFDMLLDLLKCYGATYSFDRKDTFENIEID